VAWWAKRSSRAVVSFSSPPRAFNVTPASGS
jgi:hypothetical protein